jgi:hypothetical protein
VPELSADDVARTRAWIVSQAAGKSLEEVRDSVQARRDALVAAVLSFDDDSLTTPIAPGEWSPLEALKHVVQWNWQAGEDVLHMCLMGERPGNPEPEFEADRHLLVKRLDESLESVWAHVSAADPTLFLDSKWEHFMFGDLNWREWYFFLGVHLHDHTAQLKQARAAGA